MDFAPSTLDFALTDPPRNGYSRRGNATTNAPHYGGMSWIYVELESCSAINLPQNEDSNTTPPFPPDSFEGSPFIWKIQGICMNRSCPNLKRGGYIDDTVGLYNGGL